MPEPSTSSDAPAPRGLAAGVKVFQRYTLKRVLGQGGMGVVWLAWDEKLEQEVALKFVADAWLHDANAIDRLKRETRRNLQLAHPNIVRIHDFIQDEHAAAIAMEFVNGWSLWAMRVDRPHQIFSVEEIAPWIRQLISALDYAHTHAQLVHRDLKPSNLLINHRERLKVSDFGIARNLGAQVTRSTGAGMIYGTVGYMSPQQALGEPASVLDDVYSLGATIYELLTGTPPFYKGEIMAQVMDLAPLSMTERLHELGVEDVSVPWVWEDTIARCLEKNPAKRPQSVAEVQRLLERTDVPSPAVESKHEPLVVEPVRVSLPPIVTSDEMSAIPSPARRERRRTLVAAFAGVFLLAAVLGVFIAWKMSRSSAGSTTKRTSPISQSTNVSLLVHLPLTEDFRDVSPNHRHAVINGAIAIVEGAAHFSGRNSYLELPHVPIENRPFTISFWIKVEHRDPRFALVTQRTDPSRGRFLHLVIFDGAAQFGFYSDDLRLARGAPVPGVWTHYAFRFDGANKQIYKNGVLIGQGISGAFTGEFGSLRIGDTVPWEDVKNFRGDMRDFRIYMGVLSAEQVHQLYTEGLQQRKSSAPASVAAAGSLDETFHRDGRTGDIKGMIVQPDGKILLCGYFDKQDGEWRQGIARFYDDGTLEPPGLNAQVGGTVHAITLQDDGKIILAGDFGSVNQTPAKTVARISPNGRLDDTFSTGRGGDKEARAVTVQPDGKILVSGSFLRFNGEPHRFLLRLNRNGSVDPTFRISINEMPSIIIVQPDGRVLLRGGFKQVNGIAFSGLVRLLADGQTDTSFTPSGRSANPKAIALQPDGKILCIHDGGPVIRMNADGSLDPTFAIGTGVDDRVNHLTLDNHGRMLIAGEFTAYGGRLTRNIARLNGDGSVDKTFQCKHEFDKPVRRVAATSEDDVLAAGNFNERLLRFHGGQKR